MSQGKRASEDIEMDGSPPAKMLRTSDGGSGAFAVRCPTWEPQVYSYSANLPVDIIQEIIEQLAPGPFELRGSRWDSADGYLDSPGFEEHVARRRALVSCSQTSQALRHLVLPVLYRHVRIENMRCLTSFFNSVARFPLLGTFVRQLTFTLPAPTESRYLYHLSKRLLNSLAFPEPPNPPNKSHGPYNIGLHSLLESRRKSDRTREFPCGNVGALLLPIMAFAPNLEHLSLAGYTQWTLPPYSRDLDSDPFMKFVTGTDYASVSGESSEVLCSYFPRDSLFELEGWDPDDKMSPVFPPPLLKRIDILAGPASRGRNLIISRAHIVEPRGVLQLKSLTEEMQADLNSTRKSLRPSTLLRMIRDPDVTRSVLARRYLDRVQRLDRSLYAAYDRFSGNKRPPMAAIRRNLDRALERTETMAVPVIMHAQYISMELLTFLRLGDQRRFQEPALELNLHYAASRDEPHRLLYSGEGRTLFRCIRRKFIFLCDLNMTLFVHKDSRKHVYSGFNPALKGEIEKLTLTMEALWGPVRSVVEMLEMHAPMEQWGVLEDQHRNVLGLDGNPLFDFEGNPILKPSAWEKKRSAISRIPVGCKTLCIRDWFAEYSSLATEQGLEPNVDPPADLEISQEFHTAVVIQSLQGSLEHPDWLAHTPREDGEIAAFAQGVARVHEMHQNNPEYRYPTIWGDRVYDREQLCRAKKMKAFIDRYITALATGIRAMCVYRKPSRGNGADPEPTLMTQFRPGLKHIKLVYTLQSQLPGREHCLDSHECDLSWRFWYHMDLENPGGGFHGLKREVKEASGIKLELYEGRLGVVPQEPVLPEQIKAKALKAGITLSDHNRLWEERAAERAKNSGTRRSLRLLANGNHELQW